jgi:hypothetical protein
VSGTTSTSHGTFAAAINCMDGRTQLPVNEWLRRERGVDHVDTITEPGPVRILAEKDDAAAVESVRRRVAISIERHGSRCIAVVAHHDCAGNPRVRVEQVEQLRQAAATVRGWSFGTEVLLLWVGENWTVEQVSDRTV